MPANGSVTWQVTHQQRRQVQLPNGSYVKGWEVGYTTSQGVNGDIEVTDAQYQNPQTVKALIAAEVAKTAAIGSLSSDTKAG